MLADTLDLLVRAEITLWNAVEAGLRERHGIALGRFQALRSIDRLSADGAACRVNDVAEALLVTVGGVSKLVDRLEAEGLCRRRANPQDRRSSLLEPTAKGRRLLAAATGTIEAELAGTLGALSEAELGRLTRALEKLAGR